MNKRLNSFPVRFIGISALWVWVGLSFAAIDTYDFSSDVHRQQFAVLTNELRCPKCQNQNLSDSNAPIAADMRREIHRMVEEGQSNQQVVDFMVDRYGDFVRYRPKMDASTALLWYGPVGLLILGVLVVLGVAGRRRSKNGKPAAPLADNDQERLKRLLGDDESQG